jgi:hypothetical protein
MEKLPMAENTETPEVETEISTEETATVDLAAEVEKWKSLSRKNEQQAKANAQAAKELEEFKRSQLSDTERLIEQAKEETAKSIRTEFAQKLVDAELKAALNNRVLEGNALLDFNKSTFITEDGEIDTASIQSWVEAHSKTASLPTPDLGQGNRGSNPSASQIRSRDELLNMSSAEVLQARKEGRLDALMGKQ